MIICVAGAAMSRAMVRSIVPPKKVCVVLVHSSVEAGVAKEAAEREKEEGELWLAAKMGEEAGF